MSTSRSLRGAACAVVAVALAAACDLPPSSQEWASDTAAHSETFAEQANAGQTLFTLHCARCHGGLGQGDKAPRLVGLKDGALPLDPTTELGSKRPRFVTFEDVAEFVMHSMPPKAGGSMSQADYWAILAFDMQANGIELKQKLTPELAKATTIPR